MLDNQIDRLQPDSSEFARQQELADSLRAYPVAEVRQTMLEEILARESQTGREKPLTLNEVLGAHVEVTDTGCQITQKKLGIANTPDGGEIHLFEVEYKGWPSRNLDESDQEVRTLQATMISEMLEAQLEAYILNFNGTKNYDRISHFDIPQGAQQLHERHMHWEPINERDGMFRMKPKFIRDEDREKFAEIELDQFSGGVELNSPPGTGKSYQTKVIEELGVFDWSAAEGVNRANTGFHNVIKFNYAVHLQRGATGQIEVNLLSNLFGGHMDIGQQAAEHFHLISSKFQKMHPGLFPGAEQTSDARNSLPELQKALNNQALIRQLSSFEVLTAYMQKSLARDFWINYALYAKATSHMDNKHVQPFSTGGILQDMIFIAGHMGLSAIPDKWLALLDRLPYQPAKRVGFVPQPEVWAEQVISQGDTKRAAVLEAYTLTDIYADLGERGYLKLVDPHNDREMEALLHEIEPMEQPENMVFFVRSSLQGQEKFLRSQRYYALEIKRQGLDMAPPRKSVLDEAHLAAYEKQHGLPRDVDIERPFNLVSNGYITEELSDMLTHIVTRVDEKDLITALENDPDTLRQFKQMISYLLKQSANMAAHQTQAVRHVLPSLNLEQIAKVHGTKRAQDWEKRITQLAFVDFVTMAKNLGEKAALDIDPALIAANIGLVGSVLKRSLGEVPALVDPWMEVYAQYTIPTLQKLLKNKQINRLLGYTK